MNKAFLVATLAKKTGMTKVASNEAVNALTELITDALGKGERVTIPGFGTFTTVQRRARIGRNPQTGKKIQIAAKKVVKFKAGAELASHV